MIRIGKAIIGFFFLLSVLSFAQCLFGQSGIYDRVGIIPGHGAFGSLPEENIDLFTGNVMLRYRDIYLPGPNGLDVAVWRVYNSKILKDRQSGNPSVQAYHKSWVGMGWTMHMGMVHYYSSATPVIEFPDGRLETAYPNNYGLGSNICLTRDFVKYDKTTLPPVYPKLYFKDGTIWTFGATATLTRADGTSDPVRLVTKIESPYGHHIDIVYDPGLATIQTITDATGRVVNFETDSSSPKKLLRIKVKDSVGNDRIFNYSVGNYSNSYYRLDGFTPPMLPATTFEYLDGSQSQYELTRMTTCYGGVLEYSYVNKTFYFNTTALDSRVVSQKRITFDPGNQATWNFTYPSYQGAATGTVQVQGAVFNTNVTYNAYSASTPWKIGLISARQAGDGSFSDTYDWTYQQISTTNWMVLQTNMGAAKGPLAASVIEGKVGDASSKTEYLYERTEPKRYGLATRTNLYIGPTGPLRTTKAIVYYFESHTGFKDRYMMDQTSHDELLSGQYVMTKKSDNTYFEESGKWGALKQIKRWKGGTTYLNWDYEYSCTDPIGVQIKIDPPGYSDKETIGYYFGIKCTDSLPDYTRLTRIISPHDSSITSEQRQDEGVMLYTLDNLGRIKDIELMGDYTDIHYDWPSAVNHMTITRAGNTVTKFWDGIGRDLGSTETAEGVTLYSRRTLDAEGRVLTESKGSVNSAHVYTYTYNAAGQVTSITDPRPPNPQPETTTISYQGTAKTVTDPEGHATTYVYGDLPGLPTQVTDALGKTAVYSYDAAGRLLQVIFNGARTHTYTYDGLDNVLTEIHPETGTITYAYNGENLLSSKTWGGSTLGFNYDVSKRLVQTTATTGGPIDVVNYTYNSITGRVESIVDITTGWCRENIVYNPFGCLTSEKVTIPGLAPKYLSYGYDMNNNPIGWIESVYPDHSIGTTITNNALNVPASVSFHPSANNNIPVVSSVSYGPNKMPTSITFGNNTIYSATHNNAGMLTHADLKKNGVTLYDANYDYDGAGNILSITSTAPALTATFGYDALNRLTSAAYSSGSPSTYSYEYDEYGNMLRARQNGGIVFNHTYNNKNQIPPIEGFVYDTRGNLLTSGGNIYYWDAQNRLQYIQNTSGAVIGKYLYDDRGLRLMAVPPLPEINVRHEAVDIPDGGEAFLRGPVGQTATETLTIQNLGDANLNISSVMKSDDSENNFGFTTPSSPILPNGSANLEILFHPQSSGPKTAKLTINCNDPDEGTYEINLFGNYEPEISIPQAPDGGTFDYGEIEIGDFWEQTFTIQNTGNKDLVLYGDPIVVINGADADQYEVISQPNTLLDPLPLHIGPQSSRTFVIRFSPNSEGLKTASISIANSDWDENPYDITLHGTGILGANKIDPDTAFVVTSPVEGEELVAGSIHLITWTGAPEVKEVRIDFSADNGSSYRPIVERTENTGSYPWLVPPVLSGLCLVRVSSADGTAAEAESLSVELKIKMSSAQTGSDTLGLVIRTTVPDIKILSTWSVEATLVPDEVRKVMALQLNAAGTDASASSSFFDNWHTVRLVMDYGTKAASAWLDGRPLLQMVPLVQGTWTEASPLVGIRAAGLSDVRIEDFEARYKDLTLKPEVPSEDVSQLLVKDSFEGYVEGRFPSQGGWLLNGKTDGLVEQPLPGARISPADRQGSLREDGQQRRTGDQAGNEKAEDAGLKRTQEQTSLVALLGKRVTRVDSDDSVTGLRSLRLMNDVPVELVLAKQLALPTAAPFGVSERNFAIGEVPETEAVRTLSRTRALDRLHRDEEGKRTSNDDLSAPGEKKRSSEEIDGTGKAAQARSVSLPSNKSTKLTSAAPVGNYYLYSFDGKLLQVYDIYGVLLKDFIYMGNRLIAEYDQVNMRILFYTPDQINSTRVVTNDTGNAVYSATYDPYGNARIETGSINPLLKFSGKERDAESQLDYFGARYYDRGQYRFISPDPILLYSIATDSRKVNFYSYCGNNPIVNIDASGKSYILFNKSAQTMDVYSKEGWFIGTYNASNNTAAGKEWPNGTYKALDFAPHPNNQISDSISNSGAWPFDVSDKNRTDMCIHAGRWGDADLCVPPNEGWEHSTNGCIRTDEMGMGVLNELAKEGDPPQLLIVQDDELSLYFAFRSLILKISEPVVSLAVNIGISTLGI